MTALVAPKNVQLLFTAGNPDVIVLFALKNVTTGDTFDVGGWLQFINRAVVLGIISFVEIAASFSGTVVTMPSGLSNDAGYMLLWGSGA